MSKNKSLKGSLIHTVWRDRHLLQDLCAVGEEGVIGPTVAPTAEVTSDDGTGRYPIPRAVCQQSTRVSWVSTDCNQENLSSLEPEPQFPYLKSGDYQYISP